MTEQQSSAVVLYSGPADRHAVLSRYGSAKLVRIQAERLMLTEKGKYGLEWHEALLVSQASLATGLSPYEPQPELWHWIQIKNGERQLTIMRGRDGTIRLSEEAARRDGTYLMAPKFTLIDEARIRIELGFNEDDLVVMCQVFDHRAADEYYKRRRELKVEGMESPEIDERLGNEPPSDIGYASMSLKEKSNINQKSFGIVKFPHINRVQKRAYVEALKKRWAAHINMNALADLAPMDDDSYAVEGEWQEIDVEALRNVTPPRNPTLITDPPPLPDPPKPSSAIGIGGKEPAKNKVHDAPDARPYVPAVVLKGVQIRIEKYKGTRKTERFPGDPQVTVLEALQWQLRECFIDPDFNPVDCEDAVLQHLLAGSGVEQITGAECLAVLEWLNPQKNQIGDLVPNVLSVKEARLIWKEWNSDGEKEKA